MQGQQIHLLRCFDHHEAHGWSLHGSAIASAGDDITDRDTDLGVAGEREAAAGAVDRYQNRVEPDCLVFIDKAKTWRPSIAAEASRPFASAGLAQLLLNRSQPVPESAIYGAGFFWRDSPRGDVGQYSALKHCDLVQRHLLDLSYPRLDISIYFRRFPVAHAFLPWWHSFDPGTPAATKQGTRVPPRLWIT